ncbi:MAG: hypothetical protein K2P81_00430, partial [Bacteriovoracaceae bacterium]|nr:hypothetical protein [Bacteriovoracaceae bacterium]
CGRGVAALGSMTSGTETIGVGSSACGGVLRGAVHETSSRKINIRMSSDCREGELLCKIFG